ncbi:hypothetical protein SAMN02745166_04898 [Prosthecobacter debontii]|uniref:Uncharacterized protein n=1 Tax=Prosthecobacter debontii TaxID=48467 RepID=A0A1T4Z2M4_9BACT|nr:hypothetical protein SAMN02745166_04898 [Prosthecobacter debontii]
MRVFAADGLSGLDGLSLGLVMLKKADQLFILSPTLSIVK